MAALPSLGYSSLTYKQNRAFSRHNNIYDETYLVWYNKDDMRALNSKDTSWLKLNNDKNKKEGSMMRFSQRIGKEPLKIDIQKETMDDDLRISLWNALSITIFENIDSEWISLSKFNGYFRVLWNLFFKRPFDTLNNYYDSTYKELREWYFNCEWYEVYDFIEFTAKQIPFDKEFFIIMCNNVMERELSAYRFVSDEIVEITDKNEIRAIQEAIVDSAQSNLSGVRAHLVSALTKLSDRKQPDYRNSIKESISAVESMCQMISGDPKAELGKAMKIIENQVGLHPALKKGFSSIYGYTSDEGGIRHAMLQEQDCSFEDAKYMLVSCSSFINYLIVKSSKAGIEF